MKRIGLIIVALTALLVSACNTIEGMGQDIKAGGNAIEGAAQKAK